MSDEFDRALTRRLGKLAALPVDTSRLEARLKRALPAPPDAERAASWRRAVRPLLALAASIIIVLSIVLPLTLGNREVQASAQMMAQLHEDLVSGKTPTMTADSVADANRMIAAMSSSGLTLPAVPEAHRMACCLRSVNDKQVACVLLKDGGAPVTMAVARAGDVALAQGTVVDQGGQRYHVEHVGRLTMVSLAKGGRFVCLIGAVPEGRLMEIGGALQF